MDKLGRRLSETGRVDGADKELFSQVIDYYQGNLDLVTDKLTELGYRSTSRVKTTGTLVEKLRREHGIQLTRIEDLAGARIVLDGGRPEQDECTQKIFSEFGAQVKRPKVADRRDNPSHGYRAVHVIVYISGHPVEVQLRTELQNKWAQIFERMADQWGRQIRYGGPPETESSNLFDVRVRAIGIMADLSDEIARLEQSHVKRVNLQRMLDQINSALSKSSVESDRSSTDVTLLTDMSETQQANYLGVRSRMVPVVALFEDDRRRRSRLIRRALSREKLNFPYFMRVMRWTVRKTDELIRENHEINADLEMRVRSQLDMLSTLPDRGETA